LDKKLSIVIHGQVREQTIDCIKSVLVNFPNSEVICSFHEDDSIENFPSEIIKKINILRYKFDESLDDFGHFSRNYLRHAYSAYYGIKSASNLYVLKIRSDVIIKKINLPNISFEYFNYFHINSNLPNIFVFPYYNYYRWFQGDMIIFGYKESLLSLFGNFNRDMFPNISTLNTFPELLPSKKDSYLSSEEILYLAYFKNKFALYSEIVFDDLLFNDDVAKKFMKSVSKLDVEALLPYRISSYIHSLRYKLFLKLRFNKLYCLFYKLVYK
jgi:hypothetical protein